MTSGVDMRMGVRNKNRSMSCVIALSLAWSASADVSLTLRAQGSGVTAGSGQTRTAGVPGAPGRGGQVGAPVATLSEFTVRSFDSPSFHWITERWMIVLGVPKLFCATSQLPVALSDINTVTRVARINVVMS